MTRPPLFTRSAFLLSLVALIIFSGGLHAERLNSEAHYQDIAAKKYHGETEVTMPDGTRCDIVTETHAIEVDFADKWGEAIGQSLNYGFQTNKRAGIVLILEKPSDRRHLIRVNSIIQHYGLPIDVWEIKGYEPGRVTEPDSASKVNSDFWISSTGKTHKQGCRYYGQGKGRYAKKASGNDCRICGGAR